MEQCYLSSAAAAFHVKRFGGVAEGASGIFSRPSDYSDGILISEMHKRSESAAFKRFHLSNNDANYLSTSSNVGIVVGLSQTYNIVNNFRLRPSFPHVDFSQPKHVNMTVLHLGERSDSFEHIVVPRFTHSLPAIPLTLPFIFTRDLIVDHSFITACPTSSPGVVRRGRC